MILEALEDGGQAEFRGNLCLALGLLEHKPAIKHVQEVVKERGNITLRRSAAISLGLLGVQAGVQVPVGGEQFGEFELVAMGLA